MAKKEAAFNSELTYSDLAEIGRKIARSKDFPAIRSYLKEMKSSDKVAVQRSSAIISNAADIRIDIYESFIPDFIEILRNNIHQSAPRTVFRILEKQTEIPEQHLGEIIDLSFEYLNKPDVSIAEKVFAMTVIANQLKNYPDLKHELQATLSAQFSTGSAGFKSRAGKIAAKYELDL